MTTIVESVEISRTPADVFAYVTDPSHLPEWQESVVDVQQDDGPVQVGKRAVVTRKAGSREMASTAEVAALEPPRTWSIRGVDGSVRGNVKGRVEPVNGGNRSRVTIELEPKVTASGSFFSHSSSIDKRNGRCHRTCRGSKSDSKANRRAEGRCLALNRCGLDCRRGCQEDQAEHLVGAL